MERGSERHSLKGHSHGPLPAVASGGVATLRQLDLPLDPPALEAEQQCGELGLVQEKVPA